MKTQNRNAHWRRTITKGQVFINYRTKSEYTRTQTYSPFLKLPSLIFVSTESNQVIYRFIVI